jgi:hypothetical protein
VVLGLAPSWVGLPWAYVETGARLAYPALGGVAALWGACVVGLLSNGRLPRRALGALVLLALLAVSAEQWRAQDLVFQRGARHLADAVDAMAQRPGGKVAFVNYPDRLSQRPAPFPLGYWGLTLAPVTQDMADYALAACAVHLETRSLSSFPTGAAERAAFPYAVDMRGQNAGHEALYATARWADMVYLTEYRADGTLSLRPAGAVRPDGGQPARATLGERLELVDWEMAPRSDASAQVTVRITWRPLAPLSYDDTVFVHLLSADGRLVDNGDGDGLAGLAPLFAWQVGDVVEDWRQVGVEGLPAGSYRLTLGAYDRLTGVRHKVLHRSELDVHDDEILLATIDFGL